MLAGCSSSAFLSQRHNNNNNNRLRSQLPTATAAPAPQFQACHFSMSTQSLDLPPPHHNTNTFPRKDTSRPLPQQQQQQQQPIRPPSLGISIDSSSRTTLSIQRPPSPTSAFVKNEFNWDPRGKKRFAADHESFDQPCLKRNKGGARSFDQGPVQGGVGQLGSSGNFWFNPQIPFSVSYAAGDDDDDHHQERVYFVPSQVISSPSNNPWVESVVKETTVSGDNNVEGISHRPRVKEASGSTNSSPSPSSMQRIDAHTSEQETESAHHESQLPGFGQEEEDRDEEHKGLELISSLMACVESIGSKNIVAIHHFIARLGDLASPNGTTSISRLVAYFTEALTLRITRLWPHIFHVTIPREFDRFDDDNNGTPLRLLNQVNPIPKFIHFTANEMISRAFEGKDRVHIIDFDIKQGLQWPSLFQSLASRPNPPCHVRMTGIGESKQELNETGDRLSGFAEALNLSFEFHPVVDKLEDVRLWMLHVKDQETVAVNCIFQLHKTLYDDDEHRGALMDVLGTIRSTCPATLVMAEQETENNDTRLEKRICNSLKYYSAIFDSIDSSNLPPESSARMKIEEMFAGEIRNMIACEGKERTERHECFTTWKRLMGKGGFRSISSSIRAAGDSRAMVVQSKMLLKMFNCDDKFSVGDKEGEAITLKWEDEELYTVSAWEPIPMDVAEGT